MTVEEKIGSPRTIVGYGWPWTVRPGESLDFMVSTFTDDTYQADLVRVICADNLSDPAMFKEEELTAPFSGVYPGRQQSTYAGSYVEIEANKSLNDLNSFTIQAMVFPTLLPKNDDPGVVQEQHLVSRWDKQQQKGWALLIDEQGRLAFLVGDGQTSHKVVLDKTLIQDKWYFVVASYNQEQRSVRISARLIPNSPGDVLAWSKIQREETLSPMLSLVQEGPLRFAACFDGSGNCVRLKPALCFNGRLDHVRLTAGVLDDQQALAFNQSKIPQDIKNRVVGFWDFGKGIDSIDIHDLSGKGLNGVTVNVPTRGVSGINWDGTVNDWRQRPDHYSAIHFHDDDLYDAEWEVDFSYSVPSDLPSGIYAARLRHGHSEEYIPFFVSPPKGVGHSAVALLLPTTTYMAYSNVHLNGKRLKRIKDASGKWTTVEEKWYPHVLRNPIDEEFLMRKARGPKKGWRELGKGVYSVNSDDTHCTTASQKQPNLTFKPKNMNWTLMPDTYITAWLEQAGITYDIITDDLLQAEGIELLKNYTVVMTGNHPEYYSKEMLDSVSQYQEAGGRWMYLGGNGFFWVTSYHSQLPGLIEVRKDVLYPGIPPRHERRNAFDGVAGGQWYNAARPPQLLNGVGTVLPLPFEGGSPYDRLPGSYNSRASFVFEGVTNETFGDYGIIGGGAAGEEADAIDFSQGTPAHALHLARSQDFPWPLSGPDGMTEEQYRPNVPMPHADMVFFETPNGGAVFSVGSMAWVGALSHNHYDNDVARITENVLIRFMDDRPFNFYE